MKYLKSFENYEPVITELCPSCYLPGYLMDTEDDKIRCNWCEWVGDEDSLLEYDDEDFIEYMDSNNPDKNVNAQNYNNPKDYFKDAYPLYFATKKYNL